MEPGTSRRAGGCSSSTSGSGASGAARPGTPSRAAWTSSAWGSSATRAAARRWRSPAAIAPVDGQYKPAGASARLANVSCFVLHGTHDGNMQSFHGSRVFERVRFTDGNDHLKAGLYVPRANYGQFNTTWGRGDSGGLGDRSLDLRPILPMEDQEKAARVFLSAFVEAAVRGEAGYRALFRDHRRGAGWLPRIVYLRQYEDSAGTARRRRGTLLRTHAGRAGRRDEARRRAGL